jgi:hypothetical protein
VAQQPNIELDPSDLPREGLDTSPARRWSPADKPGVITAPGQVPRGKGFGTPGPDTGWAKRIVRHMEGDIDPDLHHVLVALMSARASMFGRAPIPEDLEVAKLLCGIGEGLPLELSARRKTWLAAVPHEKSKGKSAVDEVENDLLRQKPAAVRQTLTLGL